MDVEAPKVNVVVVVVLHFVIVVVVEPVPNENPLID